MSLVVTALLVTACIGLFFLAKRFLKVAIYFANIQTFLFMVFAIEINIIQGNYIESSDGWTIIMAIMAMLNSCTYSQLDTLIIYIVSLGYSFIRTYFWVPDKSRWLKFNVYLTVGFVIMYIYSRAFHQKEREKFCKMKNQK